ncbi:Zinc finger, RING-CH-type [Dillenia turbinata]|uniref:Zinc finger, RING-CH-type n=1 Tax=Dillenia turbinata TaxID=194707 RepID=A0AAN8VP19_9MAGN
MSASEKSDVNVLEEGRRRDADNLSKSDEDEGSSWHSPINGSYEDDDNTGGDIVGINEKHRKSSVSDFSVEVDLEEVKVHLGNLARDCRICHSSLDGSSQESGIPIELGCSCKDDLAAAHKHCAEAWFKIKGNKTCEICGSLACNVTGASVSEADLMEQWNEANDVAVAATAAATSVHAAETGSFWQGHRFLNFLLTCVIFAFVISWFFHSNVPS